MGLKEWTKKIFPEYGEDADYYEEPQEMPAEEQEPARVRETQPYGTSPAGQNGVRLDSRSSSIEMKVVTPTKFDTVTQIADLLLDRKTVLLNLENTNKETAKRLIDFLSGVAYALNGDVQKVADNTFAVTPNNVAVSNESVETSVSGAGEENLYE
ncbi:MAG: cell division protein SepF [Eubacteriales bacterium]